MPSDFELQGGRKNLNMICQNVPVSTAQDMAQNIKDWLDCKLDSRQSEFAVFDNKAKTYTYEEEPISVEDYMI